MRNGISISAASADRRRLEFIAAGRSAQQKHVWRARPGTLKAMLIAEPWPADDQRPGV